MMLVRLAYRLLKGFTQLPQSSIKTYDAIPTDCGVLYGAALSPRIFPLYLDTLPAHNSAFINTRVNIIVQNHSNRTLANIRVLNYAITLYFLPLTTLIRLHIFVFF